MKDLKPVYDKLRELDHACESNGIHQATIDLVENATDRLMYAEECERLEDVIGSIHYDVSTILEIVDKKLPDYKIIKELEQLFDIDFK
jgi:hypothetical protein